ncbi:MAG: O-antigen ligase family protein [Nitrospira sp.]
MFEAPKHWVLGFLLLAVPVLIRQRTVWDTLTSPVALWCFGYAWLTVLWFFLSSQSDMAWQEVRLRFLAIIDLLMFLILFNNPAVTRIARQTLAAGVLVGVAFQIYELFVPMSFSRVLGRSAGLYMDPNLTGEALVVGMILSVTVLEPRYRAVFTLVAGIGVFLTLSRGGIVTWMIAAGSLILGGRLHLKHLALSGLIGVLLITMMLLPRWDNFLTTLERTGVINKNMEERLGWLTDPSGVSDRSSWERKYVAKRAWDKIAEHPFFGNGTGSALETDIQPHNQYLTFMLDHGLIGAMVLPLLVLAVVWGSHGETLHLGIVFGGAVMLLSLFTHTILYREHSLILFALMASMAAASRENASTKTVIFDHHHATTVQGLSRA